ncbi:MAG: toll/interleukin-1 receptor domain-containing protein [Caldilineaceae bacterium]|nr:toll/interleukin-1 receptor domain-containing protein [Caldilineaceae bacterium]
MINPQYSVGGTFAMTDQSFAYDVFLSYSSQDKSWVRNELLTRLEEAGLKTFIDFRDFEIGAPSISEMERGVGTSRRTVLVLTPAYLNSQWAEFENLLLQSSDPANRMRRLIPLLKERCELPPRIGMLTYVDFTDPEELALAWQKLLRALAAPDTKVPPPTPPPAPTNPTPNLDALRQLREALAYLYSNQRSIERLAEDAGLTIAAIDWRGPVIDNWRAVLTEAQKQGQLPKLLTLAQTEYPNNPTLATAVAAIQR